MNYLENTLTCDPGWNTGLALWSGDNRPRTFLIKEPARRKKLENEVERITYMIEKFRDYIEENTDLIVTCYIEGVELWSGSVKSQAAAQRGDTFGLAYIVGGYIGICIQNGIDTHVIYPKQWKGQMSSSILQKRIERINNQTYPQHIQEAVGLGFHVMGVL